MQIKSVFKEVIKEARKADFVELINNNVLKQEDFDKFIFKKNNFKGPFKDSVFNDIIYNSLQSGISVNFGSLPEIYNLFKQKILEPINRDKADLFIEDGNNKVSINQLIKSNTLNLSHVQSFLEEKRESKPTENFLEEIINQALRGSSQELEIVHEDNRVVVFYPQTLIGSKAACRAYFKDGKYYVDELNAQRGPVIGPVDWCIANDGDNRFNLYKNQKSLNLYIIVKKQLDNSGKGRMCLGFKKDKEGNVSLETDREYAASVTGDNFLATDKLIDQIVGRDVYNKIVQDVKKDSRPVEKPVEVYWQSYPEEGFLREFERFKNKKSSNPHIKQDFLSKVSKIIRHTENNNILDSILNCQDNDVYKEILEKNSYGHVPFSLIERFNAVELFRHIISNYGLEKYLPFDDFHKKYALRDLKSSEQELTRSMQETISAAFKPEFLQAFSQDNLVSFLKTLEDAPYRGRFSEEIPNAKKYLNQTAIERMKSLHENWWTSFPKTKSIIYGVNSIDLDPAIISHYEFVITNMNKINTKSLINFINKAYEDYFSEGKSLESTPRLRIFLRILGEFNVEFLNNFKFINQDFAERYIEQAEEALSEVEPDDRWFGYSDDFSHNLIEEIISLYSTKNDTVSFLKLVNLFKKVDKRLGQASDNFDSQVKHVIKKHKEEKGLTNYIKSYVQQYF